MTPGAHDAPSATTLHRLLGIGRDGIGRRRGSLDADVVVVDEASMVSLPLLAETLRRARPDARVVLVGDPDQLASIEVGAILSDVVEAAATTSGVMVSTLTTSHRFGEAGGVAALAAAVRGGSERAVDDAVAAHDTIRRLDPATGRAAVVDAVVDRAVAIVEAARRGDAEAALAGYASLGVLCAHKRGRRLDLVVASHRRAPPRRPRRPTCARPRLPRPPPARHAQRPADRPLERDDRRRRRGGRRAARRLRRGDPPARRRRLRRDRVGAHDPQVPGL